MVEKLPFLPDEHHYAIAAVATRSSQMEHHIEHTIYIAFLLQNNTAEFLLKNLGADRIVGLLRAKMLDMMPNEEEKITKLFSEIKRVRNERNEIMHWIWGKTEDPQTAQHATIRPYRKQIEKTKSAEDIQKIADDMLNVSKALVRWGDLFHSQHTSSLSDTLSRPTAPPNLA